MVKSLINHSKMFEKDVKFTIFGKVDYRVILSNYDSEWNSVYKKMCIKVFIFYIYFFLFINFPLKILS